MIFNLSRTHIVKPSTLGTMKEEVVVLQYIIEGRMYVLVLNSL